MHIVAAGLCWWCGLPGIPASNTCCSVLSLCLQIVFALIAFAAAASLYNGTEAYKVAKVQFMVFTGVMAFLLAIFYAIVSCVEGLKRTFSGVLEVMVNGLWVIFWLAAAASFAAYPECKYAEADTRKLTRCDVFLASQAFAWLSWFLWIGSLLIAIIEMRRGEGLTGGEAMACVQNNSRHAPAAAQFAVAWCCPACDVSSLHVSICLVLLPRKLRLVSELKQCRLPLAIIICRPKRQIACHCSVTVCRCKEVSHGQPRSLSSLRHALLISASCGF